MKAIALLRWSAVILVISLCISAFIDTRSQRLQERLLLISTALERMQHKNEALHTLITQSLLGHDLLLAASYATTYAELNASMAEAQAHIPHISSLLGAEVASLQTNSQRIRDVERHAMELMQKEQWQSAFNLMFNSQHATALKLHAIDTETTVDAVRNELESRARSLDTWRNSATALRVAALLLLLWAARRYSQHMKSQLQAQWELRGALAQANEGLEYKVHLRTRELEIANTRLAAMSMTDALTGLPNRRHLDSVLEREWLRAQREDHCLTVFMLDVDWFKGYNDHYGHPAGDACLQAIAQQLQACAMRPGDFLARYGGEEFVLIAPNTDLEGAKVLAQRIVKTVADAHMPHAASPLGQATISIGIATSSNLQPHDTAAQLLQQADQALYAAKQGGRHRWVAHDEAPQATVHPMFGMRRTTAQASLKQAYN